MDKYDMEKKDFNIYLTPKDGKYNYIIIFLHGLGDRAESYLDFFLELKYYLKIFLLD